MQVSSKFELVDKIPDPEPEVTFVVDYYNSVMMDAEFIIIGTEYTGPSAEGVDLCNRLFYIKNSDDQIVSFSSLLPEV